VTEAPADLRADTTATPLGDGRYALTITKRWDFLFPSGGVITAAALRAAAHAVGDDAYRLISATTIFCEPIQAGDVELSVEVLRGGSAAVQTRTHLRPSGAPGSPGVQVLATFGRERTGPDVRGARMPDVPLPDACPDLLADDGKNPHLRASFFDNIEARLGRGDRFWTDEFRARPARYARWFRYRRPQRDGDGRLDRLALFPIADTMPAALTQAIGPGAYRFHAPSLDLTMHVVDDTDREWVLVSAYVRRARAGWAIGEVELWDDHGRFLGFASQAMYVRTLTGEAPVRDATEPAGEP
jgi:acyl-CoA thioesterase-2